MTSRLDRKSGIGILLSTFLQMLICSSAFAQTSPRDAAPNFARLHLSDFVLENAEEIVGRCRGTHDEIVMHQGVRVLCYHGIVRATPGVAEYNRGYSIAYLNSPGGDIAHSMTLGREIFRNGAYAIVDQHCHSACGSYLLPSAKRLYITNNTVMSMHTATPRTPNDFVLSRFANELRDIMSGGQTGEGDVDIGERIIPLINEYDSFYREFVIGEMDFFKLIARDVAFAQRYREIFRTLSRRRGYSCKPQAGLHFIIGPEYLDEFNLKTIRAWFPDQRSEFVELMQNTAETDALIYDFDDHPFWIPGMGLVSPQSCLAGLATNADAPAE